jgi:hypothetical protein
MKSVKVEYLLVLIATALIILVAVIPLNLLEFLSLEIVGGPPINGLTWLEGVAALGGETSMRLLAIFGLLIILCLIPIIINWKKKPLSNRNVKIAELLLFLSATAIFLVLNILIGYAWWDPDHILGLGPLFIPSILSLIILGALPYIAKGIFKLGDECFADSTENLRKITLVMILVAFGYGLVSLIWHCCSFFEPKMFFFFFVIKLIQLWAMTTFFFKWGLPLCLNITNKWIAYLGISVLFGFCYPWHTVGFALTFTMFGILLCYLTEKTSSYLSGLILLYFAYIFHAGLAWQGPLITFAVIYPITGIILVLVFFLNFKKKALEGSI